MDGLLPIAATGCIAAAALFLYLIAPGQTLRAERLSPRLGGAGALAGFAAAGAVLRGAGHDWVTTVFATLLLAMACLSALPFLAALRRPERG